MQNKYILLKKFVLIFFTFVFTISEAQAQEQFETSYNIIYEVNSEGITTVTQNIEIENAEEDVLATTYSVTVKQMEIFNVRGEDTAGKLDIDMKRDSEKNAITLSTPLNEKVIGKGRKNELTIIYETKDLANKVGNIWNVSLPKTANLDDVKNYKATIKIPAEFGPEVFVSPKPKETDNENGYITYRFSKEELSGKNVTAAFGTNQILNFKLNFHLQNTEFFPTKQEIALPPSLKGQQEIYYESLEPAPSRIYEDTDGNLLAVYRLKPKSDLQIQLKGSAKISGRQINPIFGGKIHELPENMVKEYSGPQKYWETDSPKIKDLAAKLADPKKNVVENAQKAYKYITENLEYDYEITKQDFIERQGALKALTQKEAWACMEFTDLFITLTRAMGIPARELNGFAFSEAENVVPVSIDLNGGDMLHSWAEFYDPNFGWVPVDPTWGTTSGIDYFTKLDTNHLAFVVKGVNSEYPFPAGAYRVNTDEKQVNIDFAQNQRDFSPELEIESKVNLNIFKILGGKKKYQVTLKEGAILRNLNGTNKVLYPFQSATIYLKKDLKEVLYTDYNDTNQTFSF